MFKHLSVVLTAVLFSAIMAVSALAISAPSVTFIPDRVSTNAAFIMVADPHAAPGDSVIVTWGLNGPGVNEINRQGSFPRSGSRYVCHFSSTDNESTCGPAPFKIPSSVPPRSFSVFAVNQDNTTGVSVANISVGGIQMTPNVFTPDGKNISIRWSTSCVSTLSYRLYYAANYSDAGVAGVASYGGDGYSIDIPAGPGDYFVSLRIDAPSCTGEFGGMVLHYKTPETGVFAGGGQVNLAVDPASFEVLLNRGQNYQRTGFSMTNNGNSALANLSVAIPRDYSQVISVTLENNTIAPNSTVFYTVVLAGPQHTMEINTRVNVTSNNVTIGQIPIRVNASIVNECTAAAAVCPATPGSVISVSPAVWSGSYLAGSPAVLNFTLTNTGNATVSNISYTSSLGGSLSVTLPSALLPNGYAPASAVMDPGYAGMMSGTITITSPQGSASIAVLANFYADFSSDIEYLKTDYAEFQSQHGSQMSALAALYSDIDSDISSAESSQQNGDYQDANDYYIRAAAKLSALQSAFAAGSPVTPEPQPVNIDFATAAIVAVIIAAAAGAFFFIRRRRARGGEDELEEELAEDFGPLPGEK